MKRASHLPRWLLRRGLSMPTKVRIASAIARAAREAQAGEAQAARVVAFPDAPPIQDNIPARFRAERTHAPT
ncbi:hypothetical protein [Methylobacterium sp. JK268]